MSARNSKRRASRSPEDSRSSKKRQESPEPGELSPGTPLPPPVQTTTSTLPPLPPSVPQKPKKSVPFPFKQKKNGLLTPDLPAKVESLNYPEPDRRPLRDNERRGLRPQGDHWEPAQDSASSSRYRDSKHRESSNYRQRSPGPSYYRRSPSGSPPGRAKHRLPRRDSDASPRRDGGRNERRRDYDRDYDREYDDRDDRRRRRDRSTSRDRGRDRDHRRRYDDDREYYDDSRYQSRRDDDDRHYRSGGGYRDDYRRGDDRAWTKRGDSVDRERDRDSHRRSKRDDPSEEDRSRDRQHHALPAKPTTNGPKTPPGPPPGKPPPGLPLERAPLTPETPPGSPPRSCAPAPPPLESPPRVPVPPSTTAPPPPLVSPPPPPPSDARLKALPSHHSSVSIPLKKAESQFSPLRGSSRQVHALPSRPKGRESKPEAGEKAVLHSRPSQNNVLDSSPAIKKPEHPRVQKQKVIRRTRKQEEQVYGRVFLGCGAQDDYDVTTKLGEGTFGEVHKALERRTGRAVALKRILMHNEKEGMPVTALREIKILKALKHSCIVEILDMFVVKSTETEPLSVYMVFPYMDHDLAGLLENERVKLQPSHIKLYMKQLLEGTEYMHRNHILHRDMKAANLLINNAGSLQIADFGLARSYDANATRGGAADHRGRERKYTNCVVTRWYRPPELLLGARQYGGEVDMWGIGCVLGEMFMRRPILPGTSDLDQLDKIWQLCGTPNQHSWPNFDNLPGCEGVKRFATYGRKIHMNFQSLSSDTLDLLGRLLTCNPRERISAAQALDHDYFWTEPLPADPKTLPSYEASHEYDRRSQRHHHNPPAPPQGHPPPSSFIQGQAHGMDSRWQGGPPNSFQNFHQRGHPAPRWKPRPTELPNRPPPPNMGPNGLPSRPSNPQGGGGGRFPHRPPPPTGPVLDYSM